MILSPRGALSDQMWPDTAPTELTTIICLSHVPTAGSPWAKRQRHSVAN